MGRRPLPLSSWLLTCDASMREIAVAQGGVGAGAWTRARRGVYADATFSPAIADPEHHARCAALLACLARPAVVSHLSAVRLLGLPLPPGRLDDRACITRRPPAPSNDPLFGDVHVLDYSENDVVDVGGVSVLAGARLVLDCCDVLPPESALAIADAALARRLTTTNAMHRCLRRRRVRSRTTELVVERADPLAESWFESISRWWLLEAGLPRPRLQVPFADAGGRMRAKVDMLIGRVVGEADGAGTRRVPGAAGAVGPAVIGGGARRRRRRGAGRPRRPSAAAGTSGSVRRTTRDRTSRATPRCCARRSPWSNGWAALRRPSPRPAHFQERAERLRTLLGICDPAH